MKKAFSLWIALCMLLMAVPAAHMEAEDVVSTAVETVGDEVALELGGGEETPAAEVEEAPVAEPEELLPKAATVTGIKLNKTEPQKLALKKTLKLTATLEPRGARAAIEWTSSNEDVATVDQKGAVKGVSEGTVVITAKVEGEQEHYTAQVTVTVYDSTKPEAIALDKTDLQRIDLGKTLKLKATLSPRTARGTIAWTSSDEGVATVDQKGAVKAVSKGFATITATVEGHPGLTASVDVEVYNSKEPEAIALDKTDLQRIDLGKTLKLKATLSPRNAKGNIVWTSSDEDVATVDKKGSVKAVAKGSATITAEVEDYPDLTASVDVEVYNSKEPEAIALDKTDLQRIDLGKTLKLKANITPRNAKCTVLWSSDDESVATVDKKGSVKAVAKGSATITAEVEGYPDLTASVDVEVYNSKEPEAIALDKTDLQRIDLGKTLKLKANITPRNAKCTVLWSSDDESVATVDKNGSVKAIAKGFTTITAEVEGYPDLTASVDVEVYNSKEPEAIALDKTDLQRIDLDKTLKLKATITPRNAKCTVLWSSDDESVATVDRNGSVKAIAKGFTTITAEVEGYPDLTASVDVEVYNSAEPTGIKLNKTEEQQLDVNSTLKLTATLEPATAKGTIWWESDNEDVATVDQNGNVKAIAVGEAIISARVKDSDLGSAEVIVQVYNSAEPTGIKLNKTEEQQLDVGSTLKLTATLEPAKAKGTIEWASTDENVATVDQNGNVKAIAVGEAIISAWVKDSDLGAEVIVQVYNSAEPTGIKLNKTEEQQLDVGSTLKLTATLEPATAKGTIWWESDNEDVATVDQNGNVKAIAVGEAVISAWVMGSEIEPAEVVVQVYNSAMPTGIHLDKEGDVELKSGKTLKLTATLEPAKAKGTIQWKSDNESVATVDQNGTVTAVNPGKTVIIASVNTGEEIYDASVLIVVPEDEAPYPTSISISLPSNTLKVGYFLTPQVTFEPDGTSDEITWTISDESIAALGRFNQIRAITPGTVTITATAVHSKVSHTATLNVLPGDEGAILPTSMILDVTFVPFSQEYLENDLNGFIVMEPEGLFDGTGLDWKISDTNNFSISPDGVLKIKNLNFKQKTINVTVTAPNGLMTKAKVICVVES